MHNKKLTRICSFLLVLSILGNYAVLSSAEGNDNNVTEQVTSDDASNLFKYGENEDGTLTIYGYDGTDETVVFPSEIAGKKVSRIVCAYNKNTKYVIISEGIINLEHTFNGCENLETVSLPSTLKTIGSCTFSCCYNLSNITLPEGLTSIGDYAFEGCNSIEKLVIPDSVTDIEENSFYIGNNEYIPIYGNPNSYIKTYANTYGIKFSCINHQNIVTDLAVTPTCVNSGKTEGSHCADCGTVLEEKNYIPPTGRHTWINGICMVCKKSDPQYVTSVPDVESVFTVRHAYEIAGVKKGDTITDSNMSYKVTNSNEKEMTVEFTATKRKGSHIIIPNTVKINGVPYIVTSIAKNAFKNNKTLKNITINSNITTISANSFKGCSNLKIVKIKSKNIKSVGKNAFKGIHAKAKIKVPSSSFKKYKKLLSNKGQKSTVKIIK